MLSAPCTMFTIRRIMGCVLLPWVVSQGVFGNPTRTTPLPQRTHTPPQWRSVAALLGLAGPCLGHGRGQLTNRSRSWSPSKDQSVLVMWAHGLGPYHPNIQHGRRGPSTQRTNEQTNERTNERTNGRASARTKEGTNERTNKRTNE